MTQKTNPWTFDVRVRDRNLKAGTVTDKDVEKYLGGLPDLADQSEAFAISQPALLQPVVETVHAADTSADEGDDDDDDDDDDDGAIDGEAAGPAAPAEPAADDASTPE